MRNKKVGFGYYEDLTHSIACQFVVSYNVLLG